MSARPPILRTCKIPPSSINFIFYPQFLIALLVLTCFSIAGRTRPFGQADRASAGSVTSGDWFSDCIGAAYVCVVVESPRSNSTRIDVSSSHRKIRHLCPIKWYQISGCSVRFTVLLVWIASSYLQSTKKPKIQLGLVHPVLQPVRAFRIFFPVHCFVEFSSASSCRVAGLSV